MRTRQARSWKKAAIAVPGAAALSMTAALAFASPAAAATWPGHPGRTLITYTVRSGDTATGLAVRFHAWTAELLAINHLTPSSVLYVGERITIPQVDAAVAKAKRAAHRTVPTYAQRMAAAGWRDYTMDRDQIRRAIVRTARANGVAPDLALAVAWQESGWYAPVVSPDGAIGVMQVLPGTSEWMSLYAGRLLNPRDTQDNILAGVLFLRYLSDRSAGHVERTIASYYQGMGALKPHAHVYADTKAYVNNVMAIVNNLYQTGEPVQ